MNKEQIPFEFQLYIACVANVLLIYFSPKLPEPWKIAAMTGITFLIFEIGNAIIRYS